MFETRLLASVALWVAVATQLPTLVHAVTHGCILDRPLDRMISRVEASGTPLIELLLRFGSENDLCFGIEYPDQGLFDAQVTMSLTGVPAKDVLSQMLAKVPDYVTSVDGGIIVVRKRDVSKQT